MSDVKVNIVGNGFLLFIVLLILKLTEVIDWAWWIVTMPLWMGIAISLIIIIVTLLVAGLIGVIAMLAN